MGCIFIPHCRVLLGKAGLQQIPSRTSALKSIIEACFFIIHCDVSSVSTRDARLAVFKFFINFYFLKLSHLTSKGIFETVSIGAFSEDAINLLTCDENDSIDNLFKVSNIKLTNISEVHSFENSDRWFKAKITLFAYDEATGKEQKSNFYLLAEANDAKDAYDKTIVIMKSTMGEYSIPAINETKILEVFPFVSVSE